MTGQHVLLIKSQESQGGQTEKLCQGKQKEEEEEEDDEEEDGGERGRE